MAYDELSEYYSLNNENNDNNYTNSSDYDPDVEMDEQSIDFWNNF